MKKVILIMVLSTLSAVMNFSYAQEQSQTVVKEKTRAEVVAELKRARDAGELEKYNSETFPNVSAKSTKTRAEVLAELKDYRKTHPFPEYNY